MLNYTKTNPKYNNNLSPILLLHGLLGSLSNLSGIGNELTKINYPVVSVDLSNHGLSPHKEQISLKTMAHDIHEVITHEGFRHVIILGHSLGGKVAMQFALDYPGYVEKLIICDIAPKQYKQTFKELLATLRDTPLYKFNTRQEVAKYLQEKINIDIHMVIFILKNLRKNKDGDFFWQPNISGIYNSYQKLCLAPDGKPYQGPTLFLSGEKSDYIDEKDDKIIHTLFPDAIISEISKAGHWLHMDNKEETCNKIINFID